MSRIVCVIALAALAAGCGSSAAGRDAAAVRAWATQVAPISVRVTIG